MTGSRWIKLSEATKGKLNLNKIMSGSNRSEQRVRKTQRQGQTETHRE